MEAVAEVAFEDGMVSWSGQTPYSLGMSAEVKVKRKDQGLG